MTNMMDMCFGYGRCCSQSLPADPLLAYAYVPIQCLNKVYSFEKALERGTLFPELDKPASVYGKEFKKCEDPCDDNREMYGGAKNDCM